MSESSVVGVGVGSSAMILEEPDESRRSGSQRGHAADHGQVALCCGQCGLWPKQQTWLCAVPLLIGFIGLGLSLMLLKWIVVGSVQDYVPTDLVNAKGIGQESIFLSKPSTLPKTSDTTTTKPNIGTQSATSLPSPSNTVTEISSTTRNGHPISTTISRLNRQGKETQTQRSNSATTKPTFPLRTSRPPLTSYSSTIGSNEGISILSSKSSSPTIPPWTDDHETKLRTATPRPTSVHSRGTTSPTLPPLHSEHFQQCHEKDLTYCLNDGECFVIETLSGSHKHCKCKEGFQGIRCDQFLPKTDSILSDPTEHLGIEFMESKAVYKRQVLSITCITTGIALLGTVCMALYCRNKSRKKTQAHLKEVNFLPYGANHKILLKSHGLVQAKNYSKNSLTQTSKVNKSCLKDGIGPLTTKSKDSTGEHFCNNGCHPGKSNVAVNRKAPPTNIRKMLKPTEQSMCCPGSIYHYLQEPEMFNFDVASAEGHTGNLWDEQRKDILSVKLNDSSKLDTQSCQLIQNKLVLNDIPPPRSPTIFSSNLFYSSTTVPIIPSVLRNEDMCLQSRSGAGVIHSHGSFTPQEGIKDQEDPYMCIRSRTETQPMSQAQTLHIEAYPKPQPQVPALSNADEKQSIDNRHTVDRKTSNTQNYQLEYHAQATLLFNNREQAQLLALTLAHAHEKQGCISGGSVTRETVCILLGNGTSSACLADTRGPTETQLWKVTETKNGLYHCCK